MKRSSVRLSVRLSVPSIDSAGGNASRAPAAVHSAGVDRPGHGTSHRLQNG